MKYILGLDPGVASTGWGIIEYDENDNPIRIVDHGSVIFKPLDNDKGKLYNQVRRDARGARRVVRRRKEELGIQELAQGVSNKVVELNKLLVKYSLSLDEVAYIGDDINDLGVMSKVGFSACPKDAVSEVLERVDYIASKNGGRGAVREIFEKLMKENGMWNKVLERYLNEK